MLQLPFSEPLVWDYLVHLRRCGAAATKAMSFVQTLRFCQHVLQVDGADLCVASRRLVGQSELQAALKGPTKQARPLTVMEVRKLQKFMADPSKELQERLICSHLVLMIYTRSRNSDLAYVEALPSSRRLRTGLRSAACVSRVTETLMPSFVDLEAVSKKVQLEQLASVSCSELHV